MDSTRRRPCKIGLFIPHWEDSRNREAVRWRELSALARRAEDVGFDSLWLPDHLLFRFDGSPTQGAWDAWSLLAALAATTRRLELAPLVACVSFRNPALLAKMADTIDEISGGRLILGLGAGWHEPEYRAFGFPFDHRFSRFAEALTIIRTLLREGKIDFAGTYYQARECELRPRGPRPNGPPILIGTSGEKMLRLTARYADLWNVDRRNDLAEVQALQARVDAACVEVGRNPATLGRVIGIQIDVPDPARSRAASRQFVGPPLPFTGSPEELAEVVRSYARARTDHLIIWVDPVLPASVEALAPMLEALDRG
jgi:probable F420-dependent oxidoreductase